jgi:hypothetical protein
MRNEPSDKSEPTREPSLSRGIGALAAILALVLGFAWGLAALFKWVL